MEKVTKENLFLLEFLVDKCVISPNCVPKEISKESGETCVCFKFLDNDPMDVCEADFSPKRDYTAEDSNMKSGKSCLFSLSPSQAQEVSKCFDIDVSVFKKLATDAIPDKVQIGSAVVPIVTIFNEVISLLQAGSKPDTVSRTLKETYSIVNPDSEIIGSITVFIRMSCFGKLIVTQFQMNLEDKSVFFKDKEGKALYKYRKATKGERGLDGQSEMRGQGHAEAEGYEDGGVLYCTPDGQKPNMEGGRSNKPGGAFPKCNPQGYEECPAYKSGHEDAMAGRYDNRMQGAARDNAMYNMDKRYSTSGNMGYNNTPYSMSKTGNVFNDAMYEPMDYTRQGRADKPKGSYQEIGASMNGNGLKIRVLKDRGKVKRIDGNGSAAVMSDAGSNQRYGPSSRNRMPCCNYGQYPRACAHSDKQVLSLKPGDDPKNPFAFQVSGCDGAKNNVTVVSPTSTKADGTKVTEFSDPNKDVFVLRIGKKSEGKEQKANLEVELVTPKAMERKPAPKQETRETQYVESDLGPAAAKEGGEKAVKGAKGKGAKGKGAKGKGAKGKGAKGKGKTGKK